MEVQYDIQYANQKDFADRLTSQTNLQFQHDIIEQLCGIQYVASIRLLQLPLPSFDITRKTAINLTDRCESIMLNLIKGNGMFETWCRVMTDELLNQVLMAINSVILYT